MKSSALALAGLITGSTALPNGLAARQTPVFQIINFSVHKVGDVIDTAWFDATAPGLPQFRCNAWDPDYLGPGDVFESGRLYSCADPDTEFGRFSFSYIPETLTFFFQELLPDSFIIDGTHIFPAPLIWNPDPEDLAKRELEDRKTKVKAGSSGSSGGSTTTTPAAKVAKKVKAARKKKNEEGYQISYTATSPVNYDITLD